MTNPRLMMVAAALCAGFAIPAWAGSTGATATVTSGVGTTTGATGNASANAFVINQGYAMALGISVGANQSSTALQVDSTITKVGAASSGKGSSATTAAHGGGTAQSNAWTSQ